MSTKYKVIVKGSFMDKNELDDELKKGYELVASCGKDKGDFQYVFVYKGGVGSHGSIRRT